MSAVTGFILKKMKNKFLVMRCGLPGEILKCQQKSKYCLRKIIYVYICFKICRYKKLTTTYIGTDDQKRSTLIKCPHSSKIIALFLFLCYSTYCLFCVVLCIVCLCVNAYCTAATGWLPNCT